MIETNILLGLTMKEHRESSFYLEEHHIGVTYRLFFDISASSPPASDIRLKVTHLNANVDVSRQWVAAALPSGTRVTWDKAASADTMSRSNGRQYAYVTLAEPVTGSISLKAGNRVWTVCDKGNLVPARDSATHPAGWSPFLPASRETMQFDTVVCPTSYPIKAGDPVGHLGYFQVPSVVAH